MIEVRLNYIVSFEQSEAFDESFLVIFFTLKAQLTLYYIK